MAGTIQNREKFLNNIASNLGRKPRLSGVERPSYKFQPQHEVLKDKTTDELLEIMKEHCTKIHTDYYQTNSENLVHTLKAAIDYFGGGPITITKDERFEEFGIADLLKKELPNEGHPLHEWNPDGDVDNMALAEKSNVGITFSELTLAESATVLLLSSKEKGRAVSLLPKTYIAIIPKSTIVPRITQAAKYLRDSVQRGELVPSSINFVSGPSYSADIEMILVVGVHGPVKAAYIVVEDK